MSSKIVRNIDLNEKLMNQVISIAYGVDEPYVPHMSASIYSLLINNKEIKFKIYIIHSGISESDIKKIKKIGCHFFVEFIFFCVSDLKIYSLKVIHHFSSAMYFRLLIADLVSEKKVLYLDSDTVVVSSISELWNVDVSDHYAGAVHDTNFDRTYLGMTPDDAYFNSGVLLLNIEKIRSDRIKDRAIALLTADPDRYHLPDQDVLNLLFSGKWLSLSLGFNAHTSYYLLSDQQLTADIRECLLNPKIVHFSGPIKPWHSDFIHPYMSHYWLYRNKTPYRLSHIKYYKFQLSSLIFRTNAEFAVFRRSANLFVIRIMVWITPRSLKNNIPQALKDRIINKLLH